MAIEYHSNSVKDYPFFYSYPRTDDWWDDRYFKLSRWCNDTYGKGNWEYINQYIRFKTEADLTQFLLKWK